MNEVFVAGCGLTSALGPDLPRCLNQLRLGGVAPVRFEVAPRVSWPIYAIAEHHPNWAVRTREIVSRTTRECGALHGPRTGPMFVATSSMDIGAREDAVEFHGDYQSFAESIATWLNWRGPVVTVCTACTSSVNALLSARAAIRCGQTDHALVLGMELRNRVSVGGFGAMQLLAPARALPFGQAREGLVLGEAVAAVYLSSRPSRWRVAGGANVVDGTDPAGTMPGAVVAMCRKALDSGGLQPADIDLIKLQAAGSLIADAVEAQVLAQVFAPIPALVSLKATMGHTLGAAGAAEVALLIGCLESGVWPIADYAQDPALPARLSDFAPARARHVLAYILGFGGGHSAIILEDRDA